MNFAGKENIMDLKKLAKQFNGVWSSQSALGPTSFQTFEEEACVQHITERHNDNDGLYSNKVQYLFSVLI